MAKSRRTKKFYRSKGKWSSRIQNVDITKEIAGNSNFFESRNLALNPIQEDNTVSQKFTVKHMWVQFTIEAIGTDTLENCQAFILFIPQGFNLDDSTAYQHPEWIMASRFIGVPIAENDPGYGPFNIRSRLSRKLDTGDRIVFVLQGHNRSVNNTNTRLTGIVRYVTKAN